MNKFDLTRVPKQWAVALCALLFAALLAGSGCSAPAAESTGSAADKPVETAQGQPAMINVEVAIDMPDNGTAESTTSLVQVPEDATVYDALMASGADVQVEDSEYGKFIVAINGLENGADGKASGWVYTVNDNDVNASCDKYILANDDVVTWKFAVYDGE